MAIVVAGWYVWGDAISDKLAGVGNGGEHREARETAVAPRSATLNRSALPSPPSAAQGQKAEDAAPPVEPKSQFTLYFASGSVEISNYAQDVLALVVSLLNEFPNAGAVIEGHTDSIGDLSSNKAISESRAAAAKNHLMRKGIAPARLSTVAMGTEKPLESNDTSEGRSRNRRVVIRVVAAAPG